VSTQLDSNVKRSTRSINSINFGVYLLLIATHSAYGYWLIKQIKVRLDLKFKVRVRVRVMDRLAMGFWPAAVSPGGEQWTGCRSASHCGKYFDRQGVQRALSRNHHRLLFERSQLPYTIQRPMNVYCIATKWTYSIYQNWIVKSNNL